MQEMAEVEIVKSKAPAAYAWDTAEDDTEQEDGDNTTRGTANSPLKRPNTAPPRTNRPPFSSASRPPRAFATPPPPNTSTAPKPPHPKVSKPSDRLLREPKRKPLPEIKRVGEHKLDRAGMEGLAERLTSTAKKDKFRLNIERARQKEREQAIKEGKVLILKEGARQTIVERLYEHELEVKAKKKEKMRIAAEKAEQERKGAPLSVDQVQEFITRMYDEQRTRDQKKMKVLQGKYLASPKPSHKLRKGEQAFLQERLYTKQRERFIELKNELAAKYLQDPTSPAKRGPAHLKEVMDRLYKGQCAIEQAPRGFSCRQAVYDD
eukprot:TRINITY_DN67478_c3_g8_i1.p1 TRINITY_DN67478_c3_g8~~TRINITY_DN67478_c3_g8_i1.p1  ORF type:complete len:321 (+),score=18.60 TRINITY_DN67478_c3_g8_i1:382-1344(+)